MSLDFVSFLWQKRYLCCGIMVQLSYLMEQVPLAKSSFPLNSTAKFNTVKFQEKQSCVKAKWKNFDEKKTKIKVISETFCAHVS